MLPASLAGIPLKHVNLSLGGGDGFNEAARGLWTGPMPKKPSREFCLEVLLPCLLATTSGRPVCRGHPSPRTGADAADPVVVALLALDIFAPRRHRPEDRSEFVVVFFSRRRSQPSPQKCLSRVKSSRLLSSFSLYLLQLPTVVV